MKKKITLSRNGWEYQKKKEFGRNEIQFEIGTTFKCVHKRKGRWENGIKIKETLFFLFFLLCKIELLAAIAAVDG